MRQGHPEAGQDTAGRGTGGKELYSRVSSPDRWNDIETLAAPVSRLVALATAPLLLSLLYDLGRARRFGLLAAGLLVVVAALAAAALRVGPGVRTWILTIALGGGGLLGLLEWRWTGSTALLFWLPVWIAGLLGQVTCARVALGLGVVAFFGLYGWSVVGDRLATGSLAGEPQFWRFVVEGLTFLFVGGASLRIARAFADRLARVSTGAAREVELLTETSRGLRRDIGEVKRDLVNLQWRARRAGSLLWLMKNLLPLMADMGAVLSRVPELVAQHLGAADVSLYMLDEATEELVLRSAATVAGKTAVLRGVRVRLDVDSPIVRAAQSGEIQLAREAKEPQGKRETVVLPLVDPVSQALVGVLHVSGLLLHDLDGDSELPVLAETAELVAMGLGFARRISDEVASLESASPLYRALRDLVASTTEMQVYRTMVGTAQQFGADRVLVARMDDGVESLQVVVDADTQSEGALSSLPTSGTTTEPGLLDLMTIGAGLSEPLWVEDLADDEPRRESELRGVLSELASLGLARAGALVPLRIGEGTTLGQLVLLYRTPHRFDERERQVYRVFGDFGALVIERLKRFNEAERHLAQSQARLALGKQLRAVSEPEEILKIAVRELGQVLGTDLAAIELRPVPGPPEEVDDGTA